MNAYLLDTNVWLRLVQHDAPHHSLALDAMATILGRDDEIFVTAQNLVEFWSVASRSTGANGLGWSVQAVHLEIDRILDQFVLLDDTPEVFSLWIELVTTHHIIGRRVHDARLVAVMLAHRISHLLTFNSDDFRQFTEIVVVEPVSLVLPPQA